MKISGIYKIVSPSSKIYIGQSIDILKRFATYKKLRCKSQKKLYSSLLKHGADAHRFEIIDQCDPMLLNSKEKYYVDLYQSFNSKNGLNIRDGGGNSGKLSDEQKKKISNSLKGIKHNKERIEKNRMSQLGKKMSEEAKLKIKLNNKKPNLGKKASSETIEKLRLSHLGKKYGSRAKLTDEQKKHLSVINTGKLNPNYGKKRSDESKRKTSEKIKEYWKKKKACQEL